MLENQHLRYFIEVAGSLHVRGAAERLHIVQLALTQNIQQLKSEIGGRTLSSRETVISI
jgi:DNA-binding transcriptional LysR family regulator